MKKPFTKILLQFSLTFLLAFLFTASLTSCANVKPYEREKLADPIMDPGGQFTKQSLEQKFFSTREGSIGGPTGIGGGCGCSK